MNTATKNNTLIAMSMAAATAVAGKVKAYVHPEMIPASAIAKTLRVPTGRERLMHAIMATKEAYYHTIKGKRIPKEPTRKERLRIINSLMRKHA